MTAQAIPVTTPVGPYPTLPVSALALDVAWTTGQVGSGDNVIVVSGQTQYLLLVRNTHATLAKTITITSVADTPFNRTGDITAYSIGPGLYSAFAFTATSGWVDGSNHITIACESTDISFMLFVL